jgi:hypothetical protein
MADEIDLRKCAEFNDGHVGIPLDPAASTNPSKFGENQVFGAEIAVLLANLKICSRWLMTLTLKNVQYVMTVISVSHFNHQHVPISQKFAKTML